MSRSPFVPALFAFLFSSLFSFANTALLGDWERLDGGARLRLKLDSSGRIHGTLTNFKALSRRAPLASPRSPRRAFLTACQLLSSLSPSRGAAGPVYECAKRSHRLGSALLQSRNRLLFRNRALRESSEWKRIS